MSDPGGLSRLNPQCVIRHPELLFNLTFLPPGPITGLIHQIDYKREAGLDNIEDIYLQRLKMEAARRVEESGQ